MYPRVRIGVRHSRLRGLRGPPRLVRIKLLAADHQLVNIVRASLVTVGLAICGRGKGPERLQPRPLTDNVTSKSH